MITDKDENSKFSLQSNGMDSKPDLLVPRFRRTAYLPPAH